jgi:ferritin
MNKFDLTEKVKEELKRRNLWEQEDNEDDDSDEMDSEESELESSEENDVDDNSVVKLYRLNNKVIRLLTERLKDEYYAHYLYRAAANWCHDMNYKKAAAFFDADANTELEHATMLQTYMTDFNINPQIPSAQTKFKFDNLIDIIHQAYQFELRLMKSYNENSHSVFKEDLTTFDFLQKFRDIQKESVVEFSDLINASNLIDKEDKFQVLYFEQTYF